MPSFTVKNIPPQLYERLKQSALANRRSLNSEIITLIEQGVSRPGVDPEAVLVRDRQLRRLTRNTLATDLAFTAAKRSGRS